ncbi:MAG: class B sortase [Lachnospiraceae bacterium]|nr:class B sortase [Lachnospiraceae bacterium]
MEKIRKILMCICVAVIVFSSFKLYQQWSEYHKGEKEYQNLKNYINENNKNSDRENDDKEGVKVDFEKLKKINSQVIGWLYGKDTKINYPITQAEDNDYYLTHTFERKTNSSGCLFLDYNNMMNFKDDNSVIYGHHMKNGTMFAGLAEYKEQSYYNSHKTMLLLTPGRDYNVNIFAGYVTDEDDAAWQLSFDSDDEKKEWISKVKQKSCFTSEITPKENDHILTMSTCSYEFDDARFVLFGVLEKQ